MKTNIKLSVDPNSRILIEVSEKINCDTVIAEVKETSDEKTLHLSKLLHVKPQDISKYLKKNIGEKINSEEVIAEKKGWLSNTVVTTPVSGYIKEIDLKKGTLLVISSRSTKPIKITSPFSGTVVKIGKGYLEIEIEGVIFKGNKGEGKDTIGELIVLSGENIGILDLDRDVEGRIVVCHSFTEDFLIKLDVLGALGLVVHKFVQDMSLPWLQVESNAIHKLKEYAGKKALLRPEEKELILLE